MAWSTRELTARFSDPRNKDVIRFLCHSHPSAHDGACEELLLSARGLRGVSSYSPDPQSYAYVALHTEANVIFALAIGMSGLIFRLSPHDRHEAQKAGGTPFTEIGDAWMLIAPYRQELTLAESRGILSTWSACACRYACEEIF